MNTPIQQNRRYDIDWLRVIAIGLLIIYHTAIVFQPWGIFIRFIQSSESLEKLWIPMTMLNVWRIPLLFFISGMGLCFAVQKRSIKHVFIERSQRIFIPFIFGMFVIVPLHTLLFQKYYGQSLSLNINPSHLWFLANIFIYVLLALPIVYLWRLKPMHKIERFLIAWYRNPLALLLLSLPFIAEVLLLKPQPYELYAMNWHGFALGGIAFAMGFSFIQSGKVFWETVGKWRWLYLLISVLLYLTRFLIFNFQAPAFLLPIETLTWILSLFGFGYIHLNKPGKVLTYLSKGAYPIYILHMIFLYAACYLILPTQLSTLTKFVLISFLTFILCFAFYDLVLLRLRFLKPLFGMKKKS